MTENQSVQQGQDNVQLAWAPVPIHHPLPPRPPTVTPRRLMNIERFHPLGLNIFPLMNQYPGQVGAPIVPVFDAGRIRPPGTMAPMNPPAFGYNNFNGPFNAQGGSFNPQGATFNPQGAHFNPQAGPFNAQNPAFNLPSMPVNPQNTPMAGQVFQNSGFAPNMVVDRGSVPFDPNSPAPFVDRAQLVGPRNHGVIKIKNVSSQTRKQLCTFFLPFFSRHLLWHLLLRLVSSGQKIRCSLWAS